MAEIKKSEEHKLNRTIVTAIFIPASLLFLMTQVAFLKANVQYAPTHIFALYSVLGMALYIIAAIIFVKFCDRAWSKLNIISAIITVVSMLSIALLENEVGPTMTITNYIGYGLLALGLLDYWKNKHKINFAFMIWGLYILLWNTNYYERLSFSQGADAPLALF